MSAIRKKSFGVLAPRDANLDLADLASFEMTSEEPEHPLELVLDAGSGDWRASTDGPQTIRITFNDPQKVSRITLVFNELSVARTQEFALFTRRTSDEEWRQLVRQQFNFSPPETTREQEDYTLDMPDVTGIELQISPGAGRASLSRLVVS